MESMVRVNKGNACPVCGRTDWCLIAVDGQSAICARIEQGSKKRCGGAGWLHVFKDKPLPVRKFKVNRKPEKPLPSIDFTAIAKQYYDTSFDREGFANSLGVSTESLDRLRVGWCSEQNAYTFPMRDGYGNIIGIRTRTEHGKFSIVGSKNGLFIPAGLKHDSSELLLLVEGPTDTAALLDMGFEAIGRPSCNTGTKFIIQYIQQFNRQVVIVADNDTAKTRQDGSQFFPGQEGAARLAKEIEEIARGVRIIKPPSYKDVREWYRNGCTHNMIICLIKGAKFLKKPI